MTLNRSVELWYLPWNLFLAWVLLLIATYLVSTPLHRYLERGLLIAWLAFLPNTFYVLTDIIHINDQIRFNQTYDVLTFMITAVASFLIGLVFLPHRQEVSIKVGARCETRRPRNNCSCLRCRDLYRS